MKPLTLLIHQAFVSKGEPGGTRHYELARRMVARGQRFTVVASDLSYHTGGRLVSKPRLVTESCEDGIRVLRAYTYPGIHRSYLSRVISFLSFMTTSVFAGACVAAPDVVMGTSPPMFQAISAWMLAELHGCPFLLEVRDLWPEFAIDIGLLRSPTLIRLARFVESFLYNRADHLLVNSPAYRDYLIKRGIDSRKISFISNGVDPEMFDPHGRGEHIRTKYNLEGKFVVTYAGAIGMANDIDTLVKAAEHIRLRTDIHILIVGEGKERRRLEDVSKRLELDNITFAGSYPKNEMSMVLAASDACIALLKNIPMFTTTYPNKVFDYMAAGRPTVLAIDGVIRQVIEEAHGGIFVPPGDSKRLADAIVTLADHPLETSEMGRAARAYVVKHFNRDEHAQQLADLVSRVELRQAWS
jgi:glycosyltransferase involved in cell wall biosynthesis